MTITIISVGSQPKHELATLITSYTKRLPAHIRLQWHYIKHGSRHGSGDPQKSVQSESENIMRVISAQANVILLDETGQNLNSPQFAQKIFTPKQQSTDTVIVIGGAYGVSSDVKNRANTVLSLGKLVYPHQLVRLIIAEQLYRAYAIQSGHPYHHS